MQKLSVILILMLSISCLIASQPESKQNSTVVATRTIGRIEVDGLLNETVWQTNQKVSQFTQRDPLEGEKPTERTEVSIAYDDEALYVGAWIFDSAPDSIMARLGRRDVFVDSDRFFVFIDPYNDKRSGFYFGLNAAGTFFDGILMNDDWDDDSWDGVWDGKVHRNNKGWTLEMRIPFSQLRFQRKDKYIWGINFRRDVERKQERDYLVYTPKNESGFVSRFVDLTGLSNIHRSRHLELMPYLRTKAEYRDHEADDPFNDGSTYGPEAGVDIKYGISPNLTLDMTVNPDFGQVEVDPAVVNLSDVETFFDEKRPFFIEGASIFNNFGMGGSRSNWSFNWGNPDFFYSRRIGRTPQGSLPDYDYAKIPEGTSILGAAKISGKLGSNWNLGTIHALTAEEQGEFQYEQNRFKQALEPQTYYGITRVQKEIQNGKQGIGFISTYTHRRFEQNYLRDDLNSSALAAGVDGWTFLDSSKIWVVTGWGGYSHLKANRQRMIDLQSNSRHYYQRPDADHVDLDSNATSLNGFAGRLLVNKQKGNVIFNSAFGIISPGFDVNDTGFLWRSDLINAHLGFGYKWTKPGKFTRYTELIGAFFQSNDFDGNTTWKGVWQHGYFEFLNYYSFNYSVAYNPQTVNTRRTRGGPRTINPPGYEYNFYLNSDRRKTVIFSLETYGYILGHNDWNRSVEFGVEWKPAASLSLEITPQIFWNYDFLQWVDQFDDPYATHTFGKRYVFGQLDQREYSASFRLNWIFTPKFSFQIYAQPLISKGNYYNFKELARPGGYDFPQYRRDQIQFADDLYEIDPDGNGPAAAFAFDNPDFNITSLRGNAVVRWEYMPGSTLFFVWTQRRFEYEIDATLGFRKTASRLWNSEADNIFLVKLTYWWSI